MSMPLGVLFEDRVAGRLSYNKHNYWATSSYKASFGCINEPLLGYQTPGILGCRHAVLTTQGVPASPPLRRDGEPNDPGHTDTRTLPNGAL